MKFFFQKKTNDYIYNKKIGCIQMITNNYFEIDLIQRIKSNTKKSHRSGATVAEK